MESGKTVVFGKRPYCVLHALYRSVGGRDQRLYWDRVPERKPETRRRYLVVSNASGELFWVKHYTDTDLGDIEYEYVSSRKYGGQVVNSAFGNVKGVPALAMNEERDMLLFRYYPLFEKLRKVKKTLDAKQKKELGSLLHSWLVQVNPLDYDISETNTIVLRTPAGLIVRLVDWDYSKKASLRRHNKLLGGLGGPLLPEEFKVKA